MQLLNIIDEFPPELQTPVLHLVTALREERGVSHEDFSELKGVVQDLAKAQQELSEAQKRTENRVEELAEAQKRTENRVEELAEAQKETVRTMHLGFKEIRDSISALGSRWGIQNESTMRNTLQGVLGETNYSVRRGHYGNREVYIVIRGDGAHILLEVTAALKSSDIPKYIASADDYEAQTGVTPLIMVAAPHIPPPVIKAIMNASRPIELFSADEGL